MTPDRRRATRTLVHTIGAIVMLAFLGWIIHKTDGGGLERLGLGLIAILMLREVFHGVENSVARLKFSATTEGISGEAER